MNFRLHLTQLATWFAKHRGRNPLGTRFYKELGLYRKLRRLRAAVATDQEPLREFDRCSSREFIELAESLGTLEEQLNAVGTEASQLHVVLQGEDEDRALSSAFELYKRSVDLAHTSIGIALSQEEQMQQMEGSLLTNRDRFSRNAVMFHLLVLSIRTEAARSDPENRAVFTSVAAEIDTMASQMNTTLETAFAQLEDIVKEAAAGRTQLQEHQSGLHQRAQHSMKHLRKELDSLKLRLAPCSEASREIADLLARTRTQTGDLITSLQYQDIVRQQQEHVSEGFDDISRHLETCTIDPSFLHRVARVQRAHLNDSRNAIKKASSQITEGCDALLQTGAALVERFNAMEQAAQAVFHESQIHELFSQETENLMQLASQSESTNHRISRLLERIETSVQVFSTEIRRHEIDVQLVALNAQIAAARVPEAGALNRLAEETSRLSVDTANLTRAMSEQLGKTLSRLQGIRAEAKNVQDTVGQEKTDLVRDSVIVREKLTRLNQRILRSSGEIARSFETAYQGVRDLLPRLRFPSLINSAYAPAEMLCDSLVAATAKFGSDDLSADSHERLAQHTSRYTMQAERDAHAAALALPSLAGSDATVAEPAGSVDLFDSPPPDLTAEATPDSGATAAPPVIAPASPDLGEGVELF